MKRPRSGAGGNLRPDPEMWEALDQGRKLSAILEDFYSRGYADARLAPFFEGVTRQRAIEKQYSFLREKFTGESCYFGDRPRNAHHWMVISDEFLDYREAFLEGCLRRAGLPAHLVVRWRAVEEIFRKQMVRVHLRQEATRSGAALRGLRRAESRARLRVRWVRGKLGAGTRVRYHRRTGRTYCASCVPDPARADDPKGAQTRRLKTARAAARRGTARHALAMTI